MPGEVPGAGGLLLLGPAAAGVCAGCTTAAGRAAGCWGLELGETVGRLKALWGALALAGRASTSESESLTEMGACAEPGTAATSA